MGSSRLQVLGKGVGVGWEPMCPRSRSSCLYRAPPPTVPSDLINPHPSTCLPLTFGLAFIPPLPFRPPPLTQVYYPFNYVLPSGLLFTFCGRSGFILDYTNNTWMQVSAGQGRAGQGRGREGEGGIRK